MQATKTRANYEIKDHDLLLSDSQVREYVLKIRDLPEEEKPREKLIKHGPGVLSSAELLAIVLTTGTKKEEVLTMTSRILKEYGEKPIIHQKDPTVIEKDLGIPIAKACQIVACFELGKRFFKRNEIGPAIIRTAKDAFEYFHDMRKLPKEHFRGIYLNSHFQIIHDEIISVGSLTANIVHPREVFRPAVEYSAAAVIVAHNHPSGSPKPTEADIKITAQLMEAGKIIGIDLLDHLIITKNDFSSIMDNEKINN